MVTGTYALPRGYPSDSTRWPAGFQNSYSIAPTAPRPQSQRDLAYSTCYASPSYPTLVSPEVSGYLHSHGKARDNHKGKYLEYMLQAKGIDVEAAPPFEPVTDKVGYANHGVIKINNIPFTVSIQEITQFITRFSPIPMLKKHDSGYPIHIIMEKPTGKTMDCYIEFPSHTAAQECIRRFEHTAHPGRGTKLGTRNVSLDLSNQAELMEAVFPRARLVEFNVCTGEPSIISQDHDPSWSTGFRGYFTLEEIHGVTRFAESPSRSPFVLKCHQRVYESMITTLYKFPWAAKKTYTIRARNVLFESVYKQLSILSRKVGCPTGPASDTSSIVLQGYNGKGYASNKGPLTYDPMEVRMNNREVGLSQSLLFDLLFAAVNVPAFNLLQKLALCQAAGSYGRGISLHPFSETWPFQTLQPVLGAPEHIVKFWLELFDTGYDIMEGKYEQTGFEEYIIFTRNKIGFPIAEWTGRGVELLFEEAIKIETAVTMRYVRLGRQAWAAERQIEVHDWKTNSLEEVMTQIAIVKYADRQTEQTRTKSKSFAERETPSVSPRTTIDLRSGDPENQKKASELGPVGASSSTKASSLNAATAMDFVPASICETISSDGGVDVETHSNKSSLTNMWRKAYHPNLDIQHSKGADNRDGHPQLLKINTKVANADASSYTLPGLTGPHTVAFFKNPFSVPSNQSTTCKGRLASAATSPLEAPPNQPVSQCKSNDFGPTTRTRNRNSIILSGVSRPAHPQSQSQLNSATNKADEQMRSLSMATTVITSPRDILVDTRGSEPQQPPQYQDQHQTQIQHTPSLSSGEEVTGSIIDDPFCPRKRTHTVPNIAAARHGYSYGHGCSSRTGHAGSGVQDFGPIGSGYARSGSSSATVTVGSSEQTASRAHSTPTPVTPAIGGAGNGYIKGEHEHALGYNGRVSTGDLWGGTGSVRGRRYQHQ